MGILRLILAIVVILTHSDFFGIKLIGGVGAVEIFFIISGFYMTLILNKKYVGKGSYKLFIQNRILRIYPIFLTILILTLIFSISTGLLSNNWFKINSYVEYYNILDINTLIYLIFTNIFVFGQDIIMFLGLNIDNGNLYLTSNFRNTSPPLHIFLLIPQAWTISIELIFYAIAPLIVRKNIKIIFIFILISIFLRAFIYFYLGWQHDPWIYRFFPTELTLFLFGTLSYKFYMFIKKNNKYNFIGNYIIILFFSLILFNDIIGLEGIINQIKNWFIYILSIFTIPFLFIKTKNNKIDKQIGELSYPVYLIHVLIINIVSYLGISNNLDKYKTLLIIFLSILISIILVKFIDKPINKYRQSRIFSIQQ